MPSARLAPSLVALLLTAAAGRAAAQQAPATAPAADPARVAALDAVRTCAALGEAREIARARAEGARAEALLDQHLKRNPRDVDAIVGLARATSQCLLPAADFAGQGELSARAVELLERALEIEPAHWTARFVLASILHRSPSFLGRAPRAARELDALLAQQGDRTENPMYARVFELRGVLHVRATHADSAAAVWRRGAALFPSDTALQRLVASLPAPAAAAAAPSPAALDAVRVVATPARATVAASPVRVIPKSQVLMTAGATADVMQTVQLQPGATRVTEGADVHTRGGDASETPLVVDGGRVLALSRFEGLDGSMFGAIEPFVVRRARYSTGGFSVQHGNALSGVLEIETEGRPRERALRAGASLVQVSGTARLPIDARVGGWVSGRVSHMGALLASHGRAAEFDGAPHSAEVIASLVAAPSPMTELRATAIVARDDARRVVSAAGWRGPFHSAGESRVAQLSSRWVSSRAPLVVRANVSGSSRASAWDFGVLARGRDESGVVSRVDAEWARSSSITVRGGVEHAALARVERGVLPTSAAVSPGSPVREAVDERTAARQLGGYVEGEAAHGAASLVLGLRADRLPGERAITLDPRVALTSRVGAWTGRLSAGLFHQGRYRATAAIPDARTPSGVARSASHLAAGLALDGGFASVRAEAFVKRYGEYAAFGAGPRVTGGRARGVDVIAEKHAGGAVTGWVGYSLLDATVRLADGAVARSPFDVTHSASASAAVAVGPHWSVGSTFRYGTGAPLFGDAAGGARLPAYGRADLRLMRFVRAPAFLLTTYVEVLNLTDRRNVAAYAYDAESRSRTPVHSFFARRTLVAGGEVQFR